MLDAMQTVFDGAEAATDALHSQEGCERALMLVISTRLRPDPDAEQMMLALIDSMAHFRQTACDQVRRMQVVSMGTV